MKQIFLRAVGTLLIFVLSCTSEPLFAQQQTPAPDQNQTQPPIELPENPGRAPENVPNAPAPQISVPQSNVPQQPANQPSGTAVAPAVQVSGSAASKPAGVAIAPPKQHQVRSWLIRFGFIAGAGAALGTVAALSAASPAHVPNSPH